VNIAQEVRSLRQYRGLSQREVARLAGTSQQAISDIERDKSQPTVALLARLALALRADLKIEFRKHVEPPSSDQPLGGDVELERDIYHDAAYFLQLMSRNMADIAKIMTGWPWAEYYSRIREAGEDVVVLPLLIISVNGLQDQGVLKVIKSAAEQAERAAAERARVVEP
jgi:transcriptional regulator with XRE-family HTH domain